MFEKIKKWSAIILPIIIILFIISKFQSCSITGGILDNIKVGGNTVAVGVQPTVTPTDEDRAVVDKVVGRDAIIKGKIDLGKKQKGDDKSKVTDTSIIVVADSKCNTCAPIFVRKEKDSLFLGFSFRPKVYAGTGFGGNSFGYAQEFFRFGKATANGLVSFPTVGLGLGYDITNNFYGLLGANTNYVQYDNIGNLESYRFDPKELGVVKPLIGIGFYF